jgi:hypothetical protein
VRRGRHRGGEAHTHLASRGNGGSSLPFPKQPDRPPKIELDEEERGRGVRRGGGGGGARTQPLHDGGVSMAGPPRVLLLRWGRWGAMTRWEQRAGRQRTWRRRAGRGDVCTGGNPPRRATTPGAYGAARQRPRVPRGRSEPFLAWMPGWAATDVAGGGAEGERRDDRTLGVRMGRKCSVRRLRVQAGRTLELERVPVSRAASVPSASGVGAHPF